MTTTENVLVVGCGIAGPAVSLFLQRAGIPSAIFESRPTPDDHAGAFLNLMPNGLRVLDILGVLDEVILKGHPTDSFDFINDEGGRVGELDLRGVQSIGGVRSILIKRGALNQILRTAAQSAGISISFGKKLVHLETNAQGIVVARFEDGSDAKGAALLGCDGVHSRTRKLLLRSGAGPTYNGLMNTGSILQSSPVVPSATMTMLFGRKGFFGYQAVASGELYWFSNYPAPKKSMLEEPPEDGSVVTERLLSMHAASPPPVPDIIRSINGSVGVWPTYDLSSLPFWHSDTVCLLGDAAHAASPSAGSGASLALEDALVLAKCMRDLPTRPQAFARYETIRKPRTDWVVRQARRNDSQKLLTNPLAVWLRDRLMPLFFKLGDRAMSRIYSYNVDWD